MVARLTRWKQDGHGVGSLISFFNFFAFFRGTKRNGEAQPNKKQLHSYCTRVLCLKNNIYHNFVCCSVVHPTRVILCCCSNTNHTFFFLWQTSVNFKLFFRISNLIEIVLVFYLFKAYSYYGSLLHVMLSISHLLIFFAWVLLVFSMIYVWFLFFFIWFLVLFMLWFTVLIYVWS